MAQSEMDGYGRVLFMTKDVWPEFISCVLAVNESVIQTRRADVQRLVDGIAKSGKWLDRDMDSSDAGGRVRRQALLPSRPEAAAVRAQQAARPGQVHATLPCVRKDFEEIEQLGQEAGILKGTAHFDDYADTSFVPDETTIQPYDWEGRAVAAADQTDDAPEIVADRRAGRWYSLAGSGRRSPGVGKWTVRLTRQRPVPGPMEVALGIVELVRKGLLLKYIVASLFRVTWGFFLAVLVGVPFGLFLGWFRPAYQAFNPLIQILRPISPIAWIPLAILWFGVSDAAPVFLIFLASVFPITVSAMAAVRNLQPVYLRAASNFGLGRMRLFRRVILPATLASDPHGHADRARDRVAGRGRRRDDRRQLGPGLPDHRRPQRRQAL